MKPSSSPPLSFPSPSSLSDFLKPRILSASLSSWGTSPGTKTLHNLWLEISYGETSLLNPSTSSPTSPPVRTVNVATLKIKNPRGALLLESHQLLSDGTVRSRCRPLSEKMRPGESVEAAAERAVREELGGGARVRVRMDTYEVREEEKGSSASYPGLPARYVLHSVEAEVVDGVPEEGEFETEEEGEGVEGDEKGEPKAVFVRRHFWKWVDDYEGAGSSS